MLASSDLLSKRSTGSLVEANLESSTGIVVENITQVNILCLDSLFGW